MKTKQKQNKTMSSELFMDGWCGGGEVVRWTLVFLFFVGFQNGFDNSLIGTIVFLFS